MTVVSIVLKMLCLFGGTTKAVSELEMLPAPASTSLSLAERRDVACDGIWLWRPPVITTHEVARVGLKRLLFFA